jgi:hypothetical protein
MYYEDVILVLYEAGIGYPWLFTPEALVLTWVEWGQA